MFNKMYALLLFLIAVSQVGCNGVTTLHQDFGKSVHKNTILQTENISASQESHPDVKMDGQKADTVVDNYRSETPKAETGDLTK